MKTLPGLPFLPTGYWWEVNPSPHGSYYVVELKGPNDTISTFMSTYKTYGKGCTRSWPRPTVRSIVRVAHAVHRRWVAEEERKSAAFVGKLVGR